VALHREKTIARGVELLEEAAAGGARLVSFPETWVPGYPEWVWRLRPGGDFELSSDIHARLVESAVDLKSDHLKPIQAAARRLKLTVSMGIHERDGEFSRGTLYNTVVLIGSDGSLINRHRKLMPTNPERMVWGIGDANGLRVSETPSGRVGGLICWENYMPLARFHMYAQGVDIWLAPTLAPGDGWIATLRHIARENRMFVVGVNPVLHADRIPTDFPRRDLLVSEEYRKQNGDWIEPGNTAIVGPNGDLIAGPVREREETLIADLDLGQVLSGRRHLDPVGHYHRPDVFRLLVDTAARPAVVETSLQGL
jgi:nitrilase